MAAYKGFNINTNQTPPPWGAVEQQMVQDVIDTTAADSIQGAKDTAGHKHNKVYNPSLTPVIIASSTGIECAATFNMDSNVPINLIDSNASIVSSTSGEMNIAVSSTNSELNLSAAGVSCEISIAAAGSNSLLLISTTGDNSQLSLNSPTINLSGTVINVEESTPVTFGNADTYIKGTPDSGDVDLVLHSQRDVVFSNFNNQQYLWTDNQGHIHQGYIELSPDQNTLTINTGSTTSGVFATFVATTDSTSQSITLNANGNSNSINLYANQPNSNINMNAGESISLLANSATGDIYLSGNVHHSGADIGFCGVSPQPQQAIGATASTAGDVLTLANNIRTALINFGLAKTY